MKSGFSRVLALLLSVLTLFQLMPGIPAAAASDTVHVEIFYGYLQPYSYGSFGGPGFLLDIDSLAAKTMVSVFKDKIGTYNGKKIDVKIHHAATKAETNHAKQYAELNKVTADNTQLLIILCPDASLDSYAAHLRTYMQSGGCLWLCGENQNSKAPLEKDQHYLVNNGYISSLSATLGVSYTLGDACTGSYDKPSMADLDPGTLLGQKNQFGQYSQVGLEAANIITGYKSNSKPVITYNGGTYMIDTPVEKGYLTVSADINLLVNSSSQIKAWAAQIAYNMLDRGVKQIEDTTSPHTHSWNFTSANSTTDTITGKCTNTSGCSYNGRQLELQVVANSRVYNKSPYEGQYYVTGELAYAARVGVDSSVAAVYYDSNGNQLSETPTDAGSYQVKVPLISETKSGTKKLSAMASFEIEKATLICGYQSTADKDVLKPSITGTAMYYNGQPYNLINAGTIYWDRVGNRETRVKLLYSLDQKDWSTAVPTATDAGSYKVYWKVDGGTNYNDTPVETISAGIVPMNLPEDAYMYTKPAGLTLQYTGEAQGLVKPGTVNPDAGGGIYASNWKFQYCLGKDSANDADWSEGIPTAAAEGTYRIYWRIKGDVNHADVTPGTYVQSTISHQHEWSESWSSDAQYHWHPCTIPGCTARNLAAAHSLAWGHDDNEHWQACTVCGYKKVNNTIHTWDAGVITTPATEDEDGVKTFTCTACGAEKEEPIPRTNHEHIWGGDWQSDENEHWKNCTVTGCDKTGSRDSHTFSYDHDDAQHWQVCEICGWEGTKSAHVYEDEDDATCNTCGYQRHRHNWSAEWSADDTHHWHECTVEGCGIVENSEKGSYGTHSWDGGVVTTQPTGTSKGVQTFTCTVCQSKRTQDIPVLTFSVEGMIYGSDGKPLDGAEVKLVQGNTPFGETKTKQGKYSFPNVNQGIYNIVATQKGADTQEKVTMTKLVTVIDNLVDRDLQMPAGPINSVLEVDEGSPNVVVGGLAVEANEYSDKDITVEVKLNVEEKQEPTGVTVDEFEAKLPENAQVKLYLDFTLSKTITPDGGEEQTKPLSETKSGALELVVPYTFSESDVIVYRVHEGQIEDFSKLDAAPGEGNIRDKTFFPDRTNNLIHVYSQKFSTIAMAEVSKAQTPTSSPSSTPTSTPKPSGGGGGWGYVTVYYPINLPENLVGGGIQSSHKTAIPGTTVTLTLTADSGYELSEIAAVPKSGRSLTLTSKGGGVYTFVMPASAVDVSSGFTKIPEPDPTETPEPDPTPCPRDDSCPIWPFTDASTTAWYHDGVHYCLENGIMKGYGNNIFKPNTNTSRAMITVMLWRLSGSPAVEHSFNFTDVAADEWYTEAVRWANSEGIVTGYGDGRFGPNDVLLREQMVTILWRYAKLQGVDVSVSGTGLSSFKDANKVSAYAVPAMAWACERGLVSGMRKNYLDPKVSSSRAQIATLTMRYFEEMIPR